MWGGDATSGEASTAIYSGVHLGWLVKIPFT
jgi:hypothetical protein